MPRPGSWLYQLLASSKLAAAA